MRFPRQIAWVLMTAAACFGADLEFSHRLHLEKGLTCETCHASVKTSAEAADNNLPAEQLCLACHNGQTAPNIDASALRGRGPAPRSFWFSHEQHLELGNPAPKIAEAIDSGKYLGHVPDIREYLEHAGTCAACHRGLEEADAVDSAIHLPRMSDCLVCHDRVDNPFSCEKCHPAGVQIKPDDHTPDFIDRHSTGRMGFDKLTCEPCHGRNFTCMGCH